jgi:hypothetical protein
MSTLVEVLAALVRQGHGDSKIRATFDSRFAGRTFREACMIEECAASPTPGTFSVDAESGGVMVVFRKVDDSVTPCLVEAPNVPSFTERLTALAREARFHEVGPKELARAREVVRAARLFTESAADKGRYDANMFRELVEALERCP